MNSKPTWCYCARQSRAGDRPVRTIDEGIEILTGIPAGKRGEDGGFSEGTVHARVDARLREMAENLQHFGAEENGKRKKEEE